MSIFKTTNNNENEILIIRSLPIDGLKAAIKDIKERYPTSRIVVLTKEGDYEILSKLTEINEFIIYKTKKLNVLKLNSEFRDVSKKSFHSVFFLYKKGELFNFINVYLFVLLLKAKEKKGIEINLNMVPKIEKELSLSWKTFFGLCVFYPFFRFCNFLDKFLANFVLYGFVMIMWMFLLPYVGFRFLKKATKIKRKPLSVS
jgi:hypothetical protein